MRAQGKQLSSHPSPPSHSNTNPHSIRPESTLPICLDLGTNTQQFLDDPFYLGARHKRVATEVMTEFMEEFMHEMSVAFPKLLVQFEDFSTDNAFLYLDKFRHRYPVFNDDVRVMFHASPFLCTQLMVYVDPRYGRRRAVRLHQRR